MRRDRRGVIGPGLVLPVEQQIKLILQFVAHSSLGRGLEGIHGRTIEIAELTEEIRSRARVIECVSIFLTGDVIRRNAGGFEALDQIGFHAPGHWTDEAFGGGGE
jgi:hypothetical protein